MSLFPVFHINIHKVFHINIHKVFHINKSISINSLIELAECVLKNNIFEHDKSVFKQLRGTARGTTMVSPYAIIFMDSLEENILSNSLLKPLVWWRYTDDIFMKWEHGEEELKKFLERLLIAIILL